MKYQTLTIIFVLCSLLISPSSSQFDLYQIIIVNYSNVPQWYYPGVRLNIRKHTFGQNLQDRYVEETESGSGPGVVFYKIWNTIKLPYIIYQAYEDTKE